MKKKEENRRKKWGEKTKNGNEWCQKRRREKERKKEKRKYEGNKIRTKQGEEDDIEEI